MLKLLLLAALNLLLLNAATAQLYDVRPGELSYDGHARFALKVDVDGKASDVRDYFLDWMKTNYSVKFRNGGVLGIGKSTVASARQVQASSVANKLVDLYASFLAPSDSVTEVALFGGYDDHTFFTAAGNPSEFAALRGITQNFAAAARLKAYRDLVAAAEKQVKESEKERARLEKDEQDTRKNTTENLAKIETLKYQNQLNVKKVVQDSVMLIQNAQTREHDRLHLQQRRDRLSALNAK